VDLRAWIDKLLGRSAPQPSPEPAEPQPSPSQRPLTGEQAERDEREAPREGPLPPYET
jgi:hypothetical protein